jgi:hypothetical protein
MYLFLGSTVDMQLTKEIEEGRDAAVDLIKLETLCIKRYQSNNELFSLETSLGTMKKKPQDHESV